MNEQVEKLSSKISSLREQLDDLLAKLATAGNILEQIEQRFSQIPNLEELREYAHECGSICETIQQAKEAWETMPPDDEVKQFSRLLPTAEDLERFVEEWNDLPPLEDVEEYAQAVSGISAGLQAAE